MTATGRPGEREPSMDEILTSIRRIVSEDGPAGDPLTPDAADDEHSVESPPGPPAGDATGETPPPPAAGESAEAPAPREPAPPSPSAPSPEPLVSARTEAASVGALASLPAAEEGGKTVEQIAAGMLRPMLRDWLDAHLPDIVETAVRAEIRRLSGRVRR